MTFNLLTTPWLPVRRQDGARDVISPVDLVDHYETNPVIMPDWPRPDLNIATLEFLIGLYNLAYAPKNLEAWIGLYYTPPDKAALANALAPYESAFNFDGAGPCFMQDYDDLGEAGIPVEALFIDSAGENARKNNSDLMVKRQRYPVLSRAAAAIALYALQQFAPSGGAGHRTSMRGGGPLTTLIIPPLLNASHSQPPLWSLIWANIPLKHENAIKPEHIPHICPWMAPTRSSENGNEIHTDAPETHPLQAYFGMPRRIKMQFEPNPQRLPCALTGEVDDMIVTHYATRPYGMNYGKWRHPLTPYKKLADGNFNSSKAKPGAFQYDNWLAVVLGDTPSNDKDKEQILFPAQVVSEFYERRHSSSQGALKEKTGINARLLAAGWAMSNMTPLDFVISEQPLHLAENAKHQEELNKLARRMVNGGESAGRMLIGALQDALKTGGDKPKADSTRLDNAKQDFYQRSGVNFHHVLSQAALEPDINPDDWHCPFAEKWLKHIHTIAFAIFDTHAEPDPLDPENAKQIVEARAKLSRNLFSKNLRKTLDLPDKSKRAKSTNTPQSASPPPP